MGEGELVRGVGDRGAGDGWISEDKGVGRIRVGIVGG